MVELLIETGLGDLERARRLATADWVSDGIEPHELRLLFALVSAEDSPTPTTEFLLGIPALTDHLSGDLRIHVTRALTGLALDSPDYLEQVVSQPWFADGLVEEEAVLVVILERAADDSPVLFRDLLTARFSQTRTVEMPLTGEVRLWAVQNSPLSDGKEVLQTMEDTIRYLEELVQEPFPTNVLILSVVDSSERGYAGGGEWLNTHIRLIRNKRSGRVESIAHEAAHFIFKGPRWYSEGACELSQAYVDHRTGVQTLEQRREQLAMNDRCSRYANIRHWTHQTDELGQTPGDLCPYILGENFLHSMWSLLGRERISASLRELHRLNRDEGQPGTEELIFDVLLQNTPAEKEREFLDLYLRLHGGSFALGAANFDDDHADDATDATSAVVDRSLPGELDYLFDFDYFRFRAQEGQKYRVTVQHPALPADWVTIYEADGVTPEIDGWKSRVMTPSGPEALWTAPATGEYYFVVRNFGGLTGAYTLNIALVVDEQDDHGDTAASATSLTLGQTVNGTVDDGFDFDYFRFQVEQGQWVRVMVRGGTLESLTVALYEADGATPALMRREDVDALVSGGGEFVDIIDLRNVSWPQSVSFDWIAPRTGEFLLAVSNIEGLVGSYVATVTAIER